MPRKSKKVVVIDEAGQQQSKGPDGQFYDRKERFAHWSRTCPTRLEKKFWKMIGADENPWKFFPQVPQDEYLMDFFSHQFNLCVELDGPEHAHRKARDAKRDQALLAAGIWTLRLTAGEMAIHTPHAIIALIESCLTNMVQVQVQSPAPQAQASKATTHAQ